jgi:hypothetical protein
VVFERRKVVGVRFAKRHKINIASQSAQLGGRNERDFSSFAELNIVSMDNKTNQGTGELVKYFGLGTGIVLIISSIIGSGVYKKVAPMSLECESPGWSRCSGCCRSQR